jgi:gamma-glutamylcyclotransferase (GGCT)/AIG2-like uncharacterized protein YtfP
MIMPHSLFVYGTLMAPEVVKTLIGRVPPSMPAILKGYIRHPVIVHVFPGLIKCRDDNVCTEGLMYHELDYKEMRVLDWFEDDEYTRTNIEVQLVGDDSLNIETTQVYVWTNPGSDLDVAKSWVYREFRETRLDWYLKNTVKPCRHGLDELNY